MATEKTKRSIAALCHVLMYMLPFLFLQPSWPALFVIVSSHFVIDRWRLARCVVWAKNWLAPFWLTRVQYLHPDGSTTEGFVSGKSPIRDAKRMGQGASFSVHAINPRWSACKATGYSPDTPPFLAVWLLIIVDNIMHVVINGLALKYL